jgi:hypothetical protein
LTDKENPLVVFLSTILLFALPAAISAPYASGASDRGFSFNVACTARARDSSRWSVSRFDRRTRASWHPVGRSDNPEKGYSDFSESGVGGLNHSEAHSDVRVHRVLAKWVEGLSGRAR